MLRDRTNTPSTIERPSTWRRISFYFVVTVLLLGVTIVFWKVNLFPLLAWAPDEFLNSFYASQLEFDHITSGDFASHTIHYLAIAATHWSLIIGLALQFKRPVDNVAPMWQATGGMVVVTLTYPFIDISRIPPPVVLVIALTVVAGILHPANMFRTRPEPWNKPMLAMATAAAVPAVLMIVNQVGLQASGVAADPHWQGLHYNFMGEYGLVLLVVLALGASSLPGWRYSVWTGTFLGSLLGIGFLTHPNMTSSQGTIWGLAMVGFAIGWVLLGERRHKQTTGDRYREARQRSVT